MSGATRGTLISIGIDSDSVRMQTPPELWAVASPAVATASMIEV